MNTHLILPAFYLPPISYIHVVAKSQLPIKIEQYEHFPKQTFRTRAAIHMANGKLDLIIPVVKGSREHTKLKDVRINYEAGWQRLHWMSLQTAYRSSAYFEYYEDDFAIFYEKKYGFLLDYNMEQLHLILKLLKINREITFTESYKTDYDSALDFRENIHPKKDRGFFNAKPYYQVFEDKNGFLSDLSIVDLLFNQGPQSKQFL